MSKDERYLWVIEWRDDDGLWYPFNIHFSRQDAREYLSCYADKNIRVRKYVPAETVKE